MPHDELLAAQHEGRRRFLELVTDLRPELHRYCARMTGSIADGEDIVQDTLARAYYLLPELNVLPPFRPWLFRIAHNRALDHVRRYEARMSEPLDGMHDLADPTPDPDEVIAHAQAVQLAVSRFVELTPAQRSCVILKDVLGHSLDEIAALLDIKVPAAKAALHRGRVRLSALTEAPASMMAPQTPPSPAVARYVALFNERNWDGVRALLAEDVQLDLVSRAQRAGRSVGDYMSNYDRVADWRLVHAAMEGREVIVVFRSPEDARPSYFIELTLDEGKVRLIRDFRYVPYVMADAPAVRMITSRGMWE